MTSMSSCSNMTSEASLRQSQSQMSYHLKRDVDGAQEGTLHVQSLTHDSNQCQGEGTPTPQGLYLSNVDNATKHQANYVDDEEFDAGFGQMHCDYDMEFEESELQCHLSSDTEAHGTTHVLPEVQAVEEQEVLPFVHSQREYGHAINHPVPGSPTHFDFRANGIALQQGRGVRFPCSGQFQRSKYLQKILLQELACQSTCIKDLTHGFHYDDIGKATLTIMQQLARNGDVGKIERCVELMISLGPSPLLSRVLNVALDACKRHGNVDKAVACWTRLVEMGVTPSLIQYNTMISVCVHGGVIELAEWWLERLVKNGISPDLVTFTLLIQACGQQGFLSRAEYWLKRMHDHGLQADVVLQNAMIVAYSNNGHVWKAEETYYEMQKAGVARCHRTFNVLIHANAKHGSLERADHWYREMNSSGFRPDQYTYGSLFAGCMRKLDMTSMEYYLARMASEQLAPNHACMRSIVKTYMDCAEEDRLANVLIWCLRQRAVAQHVVRDVLSMKQTRVTSAALGELYARLCTTRPEL
eukprot:TRINITY_DN6531_c0_g2_i1.p1 TRINITY_DN6531_c0_g2~~TRINITY_DN6531_c0_g2_i1.p1  ORF type:complete len:527 (-),score=78.66 TRINITY_DN6531_c0_g2_i1:283-1863(-)